MRTPAKAHEDYGFFGPDSITWKVWTYPTSLTIGFQRSVVIEELDPFLVAAVEATNKVRYQPRTRYDRTLKYFATIAMGDTRTATKASQTLVKVHARNVGIEPLSGERFDANDPHSQLWIHLTAWHSILYAYERYGPGRLSDEEEHRYWEECAVAAELQTCDPADVPRTREGIRAYFEHMRPQLVGSDVARAMMDHLLNAEVMFPPLPRAARPAAWVVNKVLRAATIATMPRWMRELSGLRQPRIVDLAIVPLMRLNFRLSRLSTTGQLVALGQLSPMTRPVVEPVLRGVPPQRAETLTPAQARERYGVAAPAEVHARMRAAAA
jgi:uncharacterized protein (DUF2236 family)